MEYTSGDVVVVLIYLGMAICFCLGYIAGGQR